METSADIQVKICGLTRLEDALLAAKLGAWALGFIFFRGSPRFLTPKAAGKIIRQLPLGVKPVGVFVNSSRMEIQSAIDASGIQAVQYHGDETPEFISSIKVDSIKAFRLDRAEDLARIPAYRPTLGSLIDASVQGAWGGTGVKANWELASQAKQFGPLILSGGLNPENVFEGLTAVTPTAVDVSSGVEERPGVKNAALLIQFFGEVQAFNNGSKGKS